MKDCFTFNTATFVKLALIGSSLFISACNNIEHRSETIPKKALPELASKKDHPKVLWASNEGSGVSGRDAKLNLAVTHQYVVTADAAGEVRVQNRSNGKEVWRQKTPSPISSGPTVLDQVILLGTRDAQVLAYDLNHGRLLWNTSVPGEVLSSPKGTNRVVYVNTLGGSLIALDLDSGQQIWRYNLQSPSIVLRRNSSPVITSQQVIAGFANGRLVALNRREGVLDWEHEMSAPRGRSDIQRMGDISGDPVVSNGVVYAVSYQGRLAALSLNNGTPLWEKNMSSYSGVSLNNYGVFVSDTQGHLWCIDRKTGATLWEQGALEGRRLTKPVLWQNKIVVGDNDGFLHWFSQDNGAYLNRVQLDKKGIEATPVLSDNKLYTLSRGGRVAVYALDSSVAITSDSSKVTTSINSTDVETSSSNSTPTSTSNSEGT